MQYQSKRFVQAKLTYGIKPFIAGCIALALAACNQPTDATQKRAEIKPPPKLTADASKMGNETQQFMQATEALVYAGTLDQVLLEQQLFAPSRQLLTRWNTEIKQSDRTVGDQYILCKGALISLNSWARAKLDQPNLAPSRQQVYENQKRLCDHAVEDGQHAKIEG